MSGARVPGVIRCAWVGQDPLYVAYHDLEWGVPEHDDRALFEKLILDGFQAGLSWITILRKRENFRRAFDGFVPEKMVRWTPRKMAALMADPGIVRNRLKIQAAVANARAYSAAREAFGSFDACIWRFTEGRTLRHAWRNIRQIPAQTPESEAMSRELLKIGFRFVGPTICYAYMQAIGMVDDHTTDCFRHGKAAPRRAR